MLTGSEDTTACSGIEQGFIRAEPLALEQHLLGLFGTWASDGPGTVLGQQLYLSYLMRTVETSLSCFADRAVPEVASTILHHVWSIDELLRYQCQRK